MKVLVLGAGVTGLTTAWFLWKDGHEVEILDRNTGVALETSFANGGQLSYSYVAPLASPGVLSKILPWMLRRDSPLRLRVRLDPDQWRWCAEFMLACNAHQAELTTRHLLGLSFYSRSVLRELIEIEKIEFDYARNGKLVLHSSERSFEQAKRLLAYQRRLGCSQDALEPDACVALEPALANLRTRIVGGVFTAGEDVGDCYQFCKALEARMRSGFPAVHFRFECDAKRLLHQNGRISGVETTLGVMQADQYVLAAGSGAQKLARSLAIRLPIYPLKGYSLTLAIVDSLGAPQISVTDFERKIVYARLGDRLRVAGMVDLTGRDSTIDETRVAALLRQVQETFPGSTDIANPDTWCGLRSATPKGTPILGRTAYSNLFLNVGHGALGFTLAAGSGKVIADLIAGRPPKVSLDGMALAAKREQARTTRKLRAEC